jgi:hypothetical protein
MSSVWIASASGNRRAASRPSPKAAALAFFEAYPTARKCNVSEWLCDGSGFVSRRFDLTGTKPRPRDFDDVTAKAAATLPEA